MRKDDGILQHRGQMPILRRWFSVSRDPRCRYKAIQRTAARAVMTELNLETVLQINCLLLQFFFVFFPSHLLAFSSCPLSCDFSHFHPTLSALFEYLFGFCLLVCFLLILFFYLFIHFIFYYYFILSFGGRGKGLFGLDFLLLSHSLEFQSH